VEGEGAQAVAEQLDAKLRTAERKALVTRPTANPAAYDAYLRGLAIMHRTDYFVPTVAESAASQLADAVRLDPAFAQAWAWLALAHAYASYNNGGPADAIKRAHAALETAQKLAPDALDTLYAQGVVSYVERDYPAARSLMERVHARWPGNVDTLRTLGYIAARQGRWGDSKQLFDQALVLDPNNVQLLDVAQGIWLAVRDFPAAQRLIDRALLLAPEDDGILDDQMLIFASTGDLSRAQALLDRLPVDAAHPYWVEWASEIAMLRRDYPTGIRLLQGVLHNFHTSSRPTAWELRGYLAELQFQSGDHEAAQDNIRQALAESDADHASVGKDVPKQSMRSRIEFRQGDKTAAIADAEKLMAWIPASQDAFRGPDLELPYAYALACTGEKDAAIKRLEHLLEIPSMTPLTPATLKLDPELDNLRGDSRFQALLKQPPAGPVR
jgi:tetratricopeptide (TPR) repeat protein